MDSEQRYKTVCCECDRIFFACKSLGQQLGYLDAGIGNCPKCNVLLNLTFDPEKKEMKTLKYEDFISSK